MNLQLTSTDDIVKELTQRFDHCAFVGMRIRDEKKEFEELTRRFNGNHHTCIGLCKDLEDYILGDYVQDEIEQENGLE